MRHGRLDGRLAHAAGMAFVWLLLTCSPPRGVLEPWIGKAVPADSIPLTSRAVTDLALMLAAGCTDSLDSAVVAGVLQTAADTHTTLPATSPQSAVTGLQEALAGHACAVFSLRPQTYEAARALVGLSAAGIAVVVAYPPGMREPLEPDMVRRTSFSALERHAEYLRVKLISAVHSTSGGYQIVFHDGETVRGLPEDRLIGQVYPAKTPDGADTYHQIGCLFWAARQPAPTIEAHLDEWYGTMAYTFTRPALVALPR